MVKLELCIKNYLILQLELSKFDMVGPSYEFLRFLQGLSDVPCFDCLMLLTQGLWKRMGAGVLAMDVHGYPFLSLSHVETGN